MVLVTTDSRRGTVEERKARGAFFTPPALCQYVVNWAIRTSDDDVLEPSCGEAAFLTSAGDRLAELGAGRRESTALNGVELHPDSAAHASRVVQDAGHDARIVVADFFTLEPDPRYDAVIGNPPYVRYQGFAGDTRARAQKAALRAGISLTGLASSWAAFVVHSALFLKPGGRLGLVLPASLLTVNYAAEIRRFILQRFRSVRLVLFTERVFPGVQEEVVLLLADGFAQGPAEQCEISQAHNVAALPHAVSKPWRPVIPAGKWTPSLIPDGALRTAELLAAGGRFTTLQTWGDTTLGMVTGNNRYFALSPEAAHWHELEKSELIPLSPPGSRHLRGLEFTQASWRALGRAGRATLLFRPPREPSPAAAVYIKSGEALNVHQAYKCRVRSPWWRVPFVPPADILLTYMNADTPRLSANRAGVHHVNSVHGIYLRPELKETGTELLPIGTLNSVTLLGAETVGRAYGGGMLKLEPKEADLLPVPAEDLLLAAQAELTAIKPQVAKALKAGGVTAAAEMVDDILLSRHLGLPSSEIAALRAAHADLYARRIARGTEPRPAH